MPLARRLADPRPVLAPLVLNPLMAKQAEQAGFEALYLGGGAMGYAKVVLEANLSLTEMTQAGLEIVSVTSLPVILDGAAGWGDPMHLHHTIRTTQTAGFAGIEIEDQILPKRAHHHVGIEHMVPAELMAAKVAEAAAARRDPDFLIIARTNALRASNRDDAIRRLEAYRAAGADALLALARTPEDIRFVGERLPPPLVLLLPAGGLHGLGMSAVELGGLGFRLLCDTQTALLAQYHALRAVYAGLHASGAAAPPPGLSWGAVSDAVHQTVGIDALLEIERRTVED
jgi:methylisocitrate lyase